MGVIYLKWRSRRVSLGALILLAGLGIAVMAVVEFSKIRIKKSYFDEKVAASQLAFKAAEAIRTAQVGEHIVIDPVADPNATGLIGDQFTIITTDRGSLTAKLTTTNPNWAAVVVDMLREAGVEAGDKVAVGYTGSMPALNIATIAAIQTIGAEPVIIASVGASMWGANNPHFAWLDMETLLFNRGIFKHHSTAASIGGRGDVGGNVSPEGRTILREIIERNGIEKIEEATLDGNIERRVEIYKSHLREGEKYAAYINVGGGLSSIGSTQNLVPIRPGVNKRIPDANYPLRGAMIHIGTMGTPIINLTDITVLANRYGLPVAPEPMPDIPHGDVYFEDRYRMPIVILAFLVFSALVFALIRIDLNSVIFGKGKKK